MQSFKTELKKAAAVIQSHATGHGGNSGLNLGLLNLKLLEESWNKVAETQVQAGITIMEWASDESDEIRELYVKMADLDALYSLLLKRHAQQIESARQCYKAISKEEKQVLDMKKEYESQQARANKVRKQVEGAKKKKEKDKVLDGLEMDLATAYSHESKAAEDLRNAAENHSRFKMAKIQEALRITHQANQDFHNDALEIASVQDQIIQLLIGPEREEYVEKAAILASSHITTLAEVIGIPRPISVLDKQAGASFTSHQPLGPSRCGSSSSSLSSMSSRHSVPVYMEYAEREVPESARLERPLSSRAGMPLPALPLYPSLPTGREFEIEHNGDELYSEHYYAYTDFASNHPDHPSHPSGILMKSGGRGNDPPPCPPRPASSLPGFRQDPSGRPKRSSAPTTTGRGGYSSGRQGQGSPHVRPPSSEVTGQEYMSLVEEGIYDKEGNLQVNIRQPKTDEEHEENVYMSLQSFRPDIDTTQRDRNNLRNQHIYDNR